METSLPRVVSAAKGRVPHVSVLGSLPCLWKGISKDLCNLRDEYNLGEELGKDGRGRGNNYEGGSVGTLCKPTQGLQYTHAGGEQDIVTKVT